MKKIYGSTNIDMEKFSELVIFGLLLINWKSYTSDLALKTTLSKNRMRIIFFNIKIVNQLFMIHAFNHVSMLIQSRWWSHWNKLFYVLASTIGIQSIHKIANNKILHFSWFNIDTKYKIVICN